MKQITVKRVLKNSHVHTHEDGTKLYITHTTYMILESDHPKHKPGQYLGLFERFDAQVEGYKVLVTPDSDEEIDWDKILNKDE